jgi:hypothetical protein
MPRLRLVREFDAHRRAICEGRTGALTMAREQGEPP